MIKALEHLPYGTVQLEEEKAQKSLVHVFSDTLWEGIKEKESESSQY